MLPGFVPWVVPFLFALLAGALWMATHRWQRRLTDPAQVLGLKAGRFFVGAFAIWSLLQCLGRCVLLMTTWKLWAISFLGSGAIETVIWLYALERRIVGGRRGMLISGMRVAVVIMVLIMLLQPVLTLALDRRLDRHIVVMIDESHSMNFRDREWTETEKLNLAQLYEHTSIKDRQRLDVMKRELEVVRERVGLERDALPPTSGMDKDMLRDAMKIRRSSLKDLVKQHGEAVLGQQVEFLEGMLIGKSASTEEPYASLRRLHAGLESVAVSNMTAVTKALKGKAAKKPIEAIRRLDGLLGEAIVTLDASIELIPELAELTDAVFYAGLGEQAQEEIEALTQRARLEIAQHALASKREGQASLLDRLRKKYHIKLVRFGKTSEEIDPDEWVETALQAESDEKELSERQKASAGPAVGKDDRPKVDAPDPEEDEVFGLSTNMTFGQRTDLAAALETALATVAPENLAGILVVSDGRHNGDAGVDAVARRLGAQRSPIGAIVIGNSKPPKDASILNLRAPESTYLGDRVTLRSDLKFDGLKGRRIKVKLMHNKDHIDQKTIEVPDDAFRTSVRFAHTPENAEMMRYTLAIEDVEGEAFKENNKWGFDVAVSDDRTNVLLVENRPRWEYRYLRNLFYGRDKSVHLQSVLLTPDRMEGGLEPEQIHASAARKFGDADATALPESREEWLKFDVIILGDVPPEVLDDETLEILEYCVEDRGALLAVIAGQRFMPHAHSGKLLREILPIQYEPREILSFEAPEPGYRMELTPDGRRHIIMQQSTSVSENAQVWRSLPVLRWRYPVEGVKEGATILAYAIPEDRDRGGTKTAENLTAKAAAKRLDEQTKMKERNALIVEHSFGQGRVLMLNFDRTWRLRYRVGDMHHHKFWGQILRWGGGENLRSGTRFVRLGSDLVTYTHDDSVRVLARIVKPDYRPVRDAKASVKVYLDERLVRKQKLEYREGSNGIYEGLLRPFETPGQYRIELVSKAAEKIYKKEDVTKIETVFNVTGTKDPAELSELTADRGLMSKIAKLSGGEAVGPEEADRLLPVFGLGNEAVEEEKVVSLWDSWPLFLLMLACMTTEWVVRRRAGLA